MAIDVVIPVRNGGDLLKVAVDSVLSQGAPHISCFVFDNASDDGCADFLMEPSYSRVEVARSDEVLSMGESWTRASEMGIAPRLILLPADDVLVPGALERFTEAVGTLDALDPPATFAVLHSRTKLLAVTRLQAIADLVMRLAERQNASALDRVKFQNLGPDLTAYRAVGPDFLHLAASRGGNFIGPPGCVLLNRTVLTACLPWSDRNPYVIDLDMWWRMSQHDQFVRASWAGAAFRLHPGQATQTLRRRQARDIVIWLREAFAQSGTSDVGPFTFALLRLRVIAHALGRRFAHAVLAR